jgi:hypothetical protein
MSSTQCGFLRPGDIQINGNFNAGDYILRRYNCGHKTVSPNKNYSAEVLDLIRKNGTILKETLSLKHRAEEETKKTVKTVEFESGYYSYKDAIAYVDKEDENIYSLFFYVAATSNDVEFKEFDPFILPPVPPLEHSAEMSMLMSTKYDGLQFFSFSAPLQDVNIELSYGKKFVAVDELIQSKLAENKPGLYIFRGDPGTGKSTYIKYLSQKIDREILLIPNNMGHLLADPTLLSVLMGKQGAVIVLEDAEKVIQDRNIDTNSPVSSLLNLTDGFLGNVLKIAIILTFNCDKQKIDKALLRKGRLAFEYEFGKLNVTDAQTLVDSLKVEKKVTEPMSLADIYFIHDKVNAESM